MISRAQLLALGMTRRAIEHRLRSGRYTGIHRGVYAVAGAPSSAQGRAHGALLAGGPGAALTHRSAAAQWAVRAETLPPEITVPGPRLRSRPDLIVHTRPLSADEIVVRDGLRVTTPLRTLLDLAAVEPLEALERAIAEAHVLGLITPGALAHALETGPRRRGAARLRAALGSDGAAPTHSELERRMLRLIVYAGLPRPDVNTSIAGHRADFVWPEHRLIVEVDGWAAHGHRLAFERDRARDVAHQAAGWTVLRFTWRQLTERPIWVAAQLARLFS